MTALNGDAAKVAIYWDFENLHAVLTDQEFGPDYYREHRMSVQAPVADVVPVVDYAASLGDVIINRAYGNWQFFSRYRDALNGAGIDLIQMFPRGANMKNSADIRMALDALDDLHRHPHLTHIVVVSSDSDFISLAQKVKQAGKFIAGVGVERNANRFWIASCNEFRFYSSLVRLNAESESAAMAGASGLADDASGAGPAPLRSPVTDVPSMAPAAEDAFSRSLSVEEARDTLVKSLTQLVARQGENHVHRGALKSLMKRLMPAFDERALDCGSFTLFLERFPDLVRVIDTEGGGHVAMVSPGENAERPDYSTPSRS
ncbi:MAG: hypothetical protein JWQ03_2130 [Variovorax sp.]|nr:hypothetical protein [Variovorax sp.]